MTLEISGLANEITISGEGNEITITRVGAQGPSGIAADLSLGDLDDVTLSLVQQKQFIQYTGSIWRNVSLAATDIPSLDASKTTTGTFDAARIPDLSSLYASKSHTHTLSNITDAGTAAASDATDFAPAVHTHTLSDITDAGTAAASAVSDFLAASAVSAFGLTLIDDADAATARTTLGLGGLSVLDSLELNDLSDVNFSTGAGNDGDLFYYDHAAGAGAKFKGIARSSIALSEFDDDLNYEPLGSVATHAALTSGVHGISAFAATILDDADAAAVRTTIGAAATNHNHSAGQITSGTFDDARIASSNVTQHAADIDIQDLGNVVPGLLSDNLFLAYNNGTGNWTGRSPAAARTALGLGTAATSDTGDFAAASHTHTVSEISDLSDPVTSPSMTGVSAGSITGIIKCSQAQYDAITPVSTILYVIV